MRSAACALLLVSAIAPSNCDAAADDPDAAVNAGWASDARALVDMIAAVHPNPWRHSSREAVLAAALRAAEPGIPLDARRARLAAALALVGEGHTKPTDPKGEWTRLPIAFERFPDGILATVVYAGDWEISRSGSDPSPLRPEDLAGAKVKAIGGEPIDGLLERAAAYACAENAQGLAIESLRMLILGPTLTDLGLVRPDGRVELRLELAASAASGGEATALVRPGAVKQSVEYVAGFDAWRKSGLRLWSSLLEGGKVAYLAYNVCDGADPFPAVAGEFLDAASGKQVTDVVVDLRYNRGGNSWPFSSKLLPKLKKLAKQKRLWVLAGRGTFSSGIIALKELKVDAKATFVGEPTAEGYTSYGEVKNISLPYSGFSFITSSRLFKLVRGAPEGQPIEPDIRADLVCDDFLTGRDRVLERVLEAARSGS
jgi:hypothetical protein